MQQDPEIAKKPIAEIAFLGNRSHDLVDDLVTHANARTHAGMYYSQTQDGNHNMGPVYKFPPVKILLPSENYAAHSVLM